MLNEGLSFPKKGVSTRNVKTSLRNSKVFKCEYQIVGKCQSVFHDTLRSAGALQIDLSNFALSLGNSIYPGEKSNICDKISSFYSIFIKRIILPLIICLKEEYSCYSGEKCFDWVVERVVVRQIFRRA